MSADRPISDSRLAEALGLIVRKRPQSQSDDDAGSEQQETASEDAGSVDNSAAIEQVRAAINTLNEEYAAHGHAFRIEKLASGRQVLTTPEFGPLLAHFRGERQMMRLSQAALETLSIIAYRQPLLRADLEAIRGVACGEVLRGLLDRRLVRIVGRSEELGRPMLYGTTKEFLRVFGLGSIKDLPQSKELKQ